ncbi:Phosphoethanolamine N-methyltransferase 2 [Caenorhabditis elegans]|uniref:Phosphoethanolamine N-methyltransferase 2 n=1 Tax=Caenorhabditis elegans TaxID=6239 RepID=PMT2_CAEEL|nr:Phosphoethanolamine N-methyltransferase 2 [Caenorhabditis elegans]Q22993.1 RecName: Full=Phosphoethanolamine N-methyltransferase 2; Short=PMT-2; AltName: Full=S-adenosyl-L-methionine:phosphomethylethanolamine N-methyltransferase [Caenorhabditis elegans]CCD71034.1 Phosphoethanolamine N-methyltransferase 2 [Caenorhabditis elegans]|eukprot:NP_504248.1 Phosphoethanolamine MethylTransferase [Caenorhabditis elegans]
MSSLSIPRQSLYYVNKVTEGRSVSNVQVVSPCQKQGQTYVTAFTPLTSNVQVHTSLEQLSTIRNADVLIFNNALSQIITNADLLTDFLKNATNATAIGGTVIIREDLKDCSDKRQVARLTDYFDVFRTTDSDGNNTGLDLYTVDQVEHSNYVEQNFLDFIFVFRKKVFAPTTDATITFRDFLDKTQYTNTGIDAYEWMFGVNFISPGGYDENLKIIKRFGDFKPGQTMLDIGVGIGGGARQVADEFGVHVHGIDLSSNMLAIALERLHEEKDSRVKYSITDALVYQFEDNSFDYVFSRDCIQHIPDTEKLFSRIYKALKPGGKVLITMYGKGYGEQSDKFKTYVAQRAYFLKNLKEIADIANKTGFVNVQTENMTPRFKEILLEERGHLEQNEAEFMSKFTQRERDSLISGWTDKLGYIEKDNHNWNFFLAQKPFPK